MHLKPFILILIFGCISNSTALTPDQISRVDKLVHEEIMGAAGNRVAGLGLSIVEKSGQEIYARGYGLANIADGIPVTRNTKFLIASVSKTFTATLVMKVLSEKFPQLGGAVLDTPLVKLVPNANFTFSDRYRSESMTFRDILSHRHGLMTDSFGLFSGAFEEEEYLYRSRYAEEIGPYRVSYSYSNHLFSLAGKLIGDIAQKSYHTLMQELFVDLGMNSSVVMEKDTDLDSMRDMAKAYFLQNGVVTQQNSTLTHRAYVSAPAGGVLSTPEDMAKYMTFHLNLGKVGDKQVISKEAMLWMREPAMAFPAMTFKSSESSSVNGVWAFASGLVLCAHEGYSYIFHNGHWTTFLSEMRIFPDLGFATYSSINGASNINEGEKSLPYMHGQIFNIVHNITTAPKNKTVKPTKSEKKPTILSSANLTQESFVGSFGNPTDGNLEITNPNGTLYIRGGKFFTGYLVPHPEFQNTFSVDYDGIFIQEAYYFGGGELLEILIIYADIDTVYISLFGSGILYKRGVSIDTLPVIPWDPQTCGPESRESKLVKSV